MRYVFTLLMVVMLGSCMTLKTHKQEMLSLTAQKDSTINVLSNSVMEQTEKIKELNDEIVGLQSKISELENQKLAYEKELEPYKGLSEAEAKLRQVQTEKAAIQEQLDNEKMVAEQEKAAELAEKKADADRAAKEKLEDEKYQETGFRPISVKCLWQDIIDDGREFYTPKLNIKLKNVSSSSIADVALKVVFLDPDNNEVFSDVTSTFLDKYSDSPLAIGYSKEAIVAGDKGYRVHPTNVPNLRADIYVIFNYSATLVTDSTYYSGPRTYSILLLSVPVQSGN